MSIRYVYMYNIYFDSCKGIFWVSVYRAKYQVVKERDRESVLFSFLT